MPIIMCISAFAALAAMGGAPQASILMGKGDKDSAEKVLGNCTFMLTVISLVLTALFLGFGRPILLMFGASEKTILYAWNYMKIYVCGTFFVQMALGLNAFINAQGYAKTGMITVAIGALCNIISIRSLSSDCIWMCAAQHLQPSFHRVFPVSGFCVF